MEPFLVFGIPALVVVWLAARRSVWALLIPAGILVLGALMAAGTGPVEDHETDVEGLLGNVLMVAGGALLALGFVVSLVFGSRRED